MDKKLLAQKLTAALKDATVDIRETCICSSCNRSVGPWKATAIQWREILPDGSWWYPEQDGCYMVYGPFVSIDKAIRKMVYESEQIYNIEDLLYALDRTDPSKAASSVALTEDNVDLVEPDNKLFEFSISYYTTGRRKLTLTECNDCNGDDGEDDYDGKSEAAREKLYSDAYEMHYEE